MKNTKENNIIRSGTITRFFIEENYIQGHTLYNLIREYFNYYLNFDLGMNSRNKIFINKVLNNLNIKFGINFGNGKMIKDEI